MRTQITTRLECHITEQHIEEGTLGCVDRCAAALAVVAACERENIECRIVRVCDTTVVIVHAWNYGRESCALTPKALMEWVERYDAQYAGKPVAPMSFTLEFAGPLPKNN